MKNILIIETEYEGHYLTGYIKYILRSFKDKKIKITLLTSCETILHGKGALKILKKEKIPFAIETLKTSKPKNYSKLQLFLNQVNNYFEIKKKFNLLYKINKFDFIILTSLQKYKVGLAIFGSPFGNIKFTGIFLGAKFHLNFFNINKKNFYYLLLEGVFKKMLNIPTLTNLITNDHLLEEYVNIYGWKNKSKIKFLHDPKEFNYIYKKRVARDKLKLPKKSIIILVYGALMDSKGIKELLNIFLFIKKIDVRLILAGKQLESIKEYFNNNFIYTNSLINNKKVFLFNEWIDEKKESYLFCASDIVWIGYKNYFSPSGVLYQAAQISKPIITSNNGFVNYINKKIKVGYSVDINNTIELIETIKKIKIKKNLTILKKNLNSFAKVSNAENWVIKFKKIHPDLFD